MTGGKSTVGSGTGANVLIIGGQGGPGTSLPNPIPPGAGGDIILRGGPGGILGGPIPLPGPEGRVLIESNCEVIGGLSITGNISKGGGSFKIDHPLDPENKYLYHSFVESPDMMNIYNGNAVTDGRGYATIALPD